MQSEPSASLSQAISSLIFQGTIVDPTVNRCYLLVFGIGCAVMSELVLLLDFCVFAVRGWSFLRLRHEFGRSLIAAVLMPTAAGIVGMFGLGLDVLQGSRAACIAVGIAWPSLMTVLFGVTDQTDTDDDDPELGEELVE